MDKEYYKNEFMLGVNYWASHAGTAMWKNWNAEIVEADLRLLGEYGIKVLRIFPLWEDFQPITALLSYAGEVHEISFGEEFLSDDEEGRAGVSSSAMKKFEDFLDIADKYGFKVIVSVLTAWMSGRCFFPPAISGRSVYSDPFCIKWEERFVKYFVKRFKGRECIVAWELGNECNCMGKASSSDEAWVWTSSIVNCIKSEDQTRPVFSGMHSLANGDKWNVKDQAELCDVLTVHPYALFTPYCDFDPLVSPRTITHSAAELTLYGDIGNRPCFVEEIGTLGSTFGSEEKVADFIRASLFCAWQNGGLGMLWWTGFDQTHLKRAPYDWCDVERDLGLFKSDYSPKPAANEYKKFGELISSFPFELSERERNAACLVFQNYWGLAFGSYMCGKRAGIDLKFSSREIVPDGYSLYIAPGMQTAEFMQTRALDVLLEKVKNGAVLLTTYDGGALVPFEQITGCKSLGRSKACALETEFNGKKISIPRNYALSLSPVSAKVLATDGDGKPCLTVNDFGKGKVIFFNAPLERFVATTENVVTAADSGIEAVYAYAAELAGIKRKVICDNPLVDITLHPLSETKTVAVLRNDTENAVVSKIKTDGKIIKVLYGNVSKNIIKLPPANAAVIMIDNV